MTYKYIDLKIENHVATVAMARVEALNALSLEFASEIAASPPGGPADDAGHWYPRLEPGFDAPGDWGAARETSRAHTARRSQVVSIIGEEPARPRPALWTAGERNFVTMPGR